MAARTAGGDTGVTTPAIVVVLVIVLGATIYLRHARYIRRNTAYTTIGLIVLALIALGVWMYFYGS